MLHKIFLLVFILFSGFGYVQASENNLQNVFKIYSYGYNPITEIYEPQASGSAVYVGDGSIITNAHVIADENDNPYNYYEVCRTYSFREKPSCFSTATLQHYDVNTDIAFLKLTNNPGDLGPGVSWSLKEINIGDTVSVLGYPGTGGDTITLSEGKISGYTNGYYKTDSDIDSGNSGGGVFNSTHEFVGMPTLLISESANVGYIIGVEDILEYVSLTKTQTPYAHNTNEFQSLWNKHKTTVRNTNILSVPGIQIRKPSQYNFEILSYNIVKSGLAEYFLKSTRGETYIQLENYEVLQSDVSIRDTWNDLETSETHRVIKKELTLGGKELTLLAYIDLENQDISMYFFSKSSSFIIHGNLTDSKTLIDALKLLVSNTDILEQASHTSTLNFRGFQLTTQETLFSSNELKDSTVTNYSSLSGNEIELQFKVLSSDQSFDDLESSYDAILEKYFEVGSEEEGYTLEKAELVKNTQAEVFILTKQVSQAAANIFYTLTKYTNLQGVDGYYFAVISVPQDRDLTLRPYLLNFLDTLKLDGSDPVPVGDSQNIQSIQQFFQ